MQRSALSDAQLREEVAALQQQGHRRLLVLTGEHPKYTFDEFLKAIDVISSGGWQAGRKGGDMRVGARRLTGGVGARGWPTAVHRCGAADGCCRRRADAAGQQLSRHSHHHPPSPPAVRTEPCGNIRRINVEIPSLSLSDMRRLKATDKVLGWRHGAWGWGAAEEQRGMPRKWMGCCQQALPCLVCSLSHRCPLSTMLQPITPLAPLLPLRRRLAPVSMYKF